MAARIALLGLATAAALAPVEARAQLEIQFGTQTFEEDVLLDFDHLVPDTELAPGDPIAPGVVFGGGPGDPARQRARVVDVGGGDRELQQVPVGPLAVPSTIVFSFAAPVTDAGAVVTAVADGAGNPGVTAFGSGGGTLSSFGAFADDPGETGFFGFTGGVLPATGIAALAFEPSSATTDGMRFRVDDLAYAPEPAAGAGGAAAGAMLAAIRGWRRRR